jgi:hypothetical protein
MSDEIAALQAKLGTGGKAPEAKGAAGGTQEPLKLETPSANTLPNEKPPVKVEAPPATGGK